jgi:abhydrolase domain-containing protein 17
MTDSILFKLIRTSALLYLLLHIGACAFAEKLIFCPQEPSYQDNENTLKITTPDGEKITAIFLENKNAPYTLLFNHGNAEDLGLIVPFLSRFHQMGYSIIMYDYRGYGTSDGKPSEKNCYRDVFAVYRWLTEEKNIPPHQIIAQGRSVGGGPASWLAAHHPVGGLILESTFVSAYRVKTIIPVTPFDKFPNLRHVKQASCPTLIMHGTHDEIIPFWHGEKLYENAPEPKMKLWIEGARHNDYAYVAGEDYFETVKRFLDSLHENLHP